MFSLSRLSVFTALVLCLSSVPGVEATPDGSLAFRFAGVATSNGGNRMVVKFAEPRTRDTITRDNVLKRVNANAREVAKAAKARESRTNGKDGGVVGKKGLPAGVVLSESGSLKIEQIGGNVDVVATKSRDGSLRFDYIVDGKEFTSILHPFCNSRINRVSGPYNPDHCANFAEQEVDMILMLMDLLSKGVPEQRARGFYEEIACLSRKHAESVRGKPLQVCFRRDYSKVVGELLAKWVKPVLGDIAKFNIGTLSSRMLLMDDADESMLNVTSRRSADLDAIFREMNRETSVNGHAMENSCCSQCYAGHYFPHLSHDQCKKQPFGTHCCHTVCKALMRVKTGMTSSVSYCCPHLQPQPCLK